MLVAAILGFLVATLIGLPDASLHSVGFQRGVRGQVALCVGLVGGLSGGLIGEVLHQGMGLPSFFGWMLVGLAIGASIGVYDLFQALTSGHPARPATRKIVNGIIGGVVGGLVGGV